MPPLISQVQKQTVTRGARAQQEEAVDRTMEMVGVMAAVDEAAGKVVVREGGEGKTWDSVSTTSCAASDRMDPSRALE
jgi:hypothetical protein